MISLVVSKFLKTAIVSEHSRLDVGVAFDSGSCKAHSRVNYRTAVLKSKEKIVRKHLEFFNKVADLIFQISFFIEYLHETVSLSCRIFIF